ncbi:MAG: hypothetical protein ACOX9C_07660 [Kiritimatiellia bacterium]|jgi:hypothetical protein
MKTRLLATILAIVSAVLIVRAVDIHVDSAAVAGGDGSSATPYNTFAQGLAAAESGDTILVHGDAGQTYTDYPYAVWQTNLTVAAVGTGRPLFSVTANAITNWDSAVFVVSAPGFRLAHVDFYGTPEKCSCEYSAIVQFYDDADNGIVEGCAFNWSTKNTVKMGWNIRGDKATNIVVRGNVFTNHRSQYSNGTVVCLGDHARVIGNVFTNMQTAARLGDYGVVVSNTVVNSNSAIGALLNGKTTQNRSALIAFNTAVQSNGANNPAIWKSREGLTAVVASAPTRIHNNTVVGSTHFIRCEKSDYNASHWGPVIVNNIALCTSTNIVDVSTSIHTNQYTGSGLSAFITDTIIQNNILTSDLDVIFEDRVTLLCSDNVDDNLERDVAFCDTVDLDSDRYFAPDVLEKPYINAGYGTAQNGYPRYIGAKPADVPLSTILTIR